MSFILTLLCHLVTELCSQLPGVGQIASTVLYKHSVNLPFHYKQQKLIDTFGNKIVNYVTTKAVIANMLANQYLFSHPAEDCTLSVQSSFCSDLWSNSLLLAVLCLHHLLRKKPPQPDTCMSLFTPRVYVPASANMQWLYCSF